MKNRRPCSEIKLEISNIKGNIAHIKKSIKSGVYSGDDLENLKRNLQYEIERLNEMNEKLNDCE